VIVGREIICIDFILLSKMNAASVIPKMTLLPLDALLIQLFCVLYSLPLQGQMGFITVWNFNGGCWSTDKKFYCLSL